METSFGSKEIGSREFGQTKTIDQILSQLQADYSSDDRLNGDVVGKIKLLRRIIKDEGLSEVEISEKHIGNIKNFAAGQFAKEDPNETVDSIKEFLELIKQ